MSCHADKNVMFLRAKQLMWLLMLYNVVSIFAGLAGTARSVDSPSAPFHLVCNSRNTANPDALQIRHRWRNTLSTWESEVPNSCLFLTSKSKAE
jgi:hypothetical protein